MAFLKPDKVLNINGVVCKQYIIPNHNVNKLQLPGIRTLECVGITVHNTPSITPSKGTTQSEQYSRATVNGNIPGVFVHFYVDDVEIWQNLPCNYQSWHAGSKKNGVGEPEANGSHLGNRATISIEVIGNTAKAEDNAARLVAHLMDTYGFTSEQIYTHNYWVNIRRGARAASGEDLRTKPDGYKSCPVYIIPHWQDFVSKVESYRKSQTQNSRLFYVQVGAFSSESNAKNFLNDVQKNYPNAFIKKVNKLYYVQVGAFSSKDNAERYLSTVKTKYKNAFIKTF